LLQNLESLRVGLHQAILDAVVHHLDEVAGAVRSRMNITTLGARIATVAAGRSRHVSNCRRKRGKNRVEAVGDLLLAANPHAVAALQTPDAAARSNVDIMQTALPECGRAANIVLPERIAAVHDHISRLPQPTQLI